MKKTLKSIQSKYGMLNEAYAWERTPGKPLPTLADVQNNYNAKSVNEQEMMSDSEMGYRLSQIIKMLPEIEAYTDKANRALRNARMTPEQPDIIRNTVKHLERAMREISKMGG
jgi:hypothetical protein